MSPTEEKIRSILAKQLEVDEDTVTADTDIAEDLGADSLDIVELMMSVEEEFGVTIEEEKAQTFRTVKDVAAYIDDTV